MQIQIIWPPEVEDIESLMNIFGRPCQAFEPLSDCSKKKVKNSQDSKNNKKPKRGDLVDEL